MYKVVAAALCVVSRGIQTTAIKRSPLVISSKKFMEHVPKSSHHERPERIEECLKAVNSIYDSIQYKLPSGELDDARYPFPVFTVEESISGKHPLSRRRDEALSVIKSVHDHEYIAEVEKLCRLGARALSPWDSDTYISKNSYEVCLLAQVWPFLSIANQTGLILSLLQECVDGWRR